MSLTTVHSDISSAIGRGALYDARIPRWAAEAVRNLEQNYTFNYMFQVQDFSLLTAADSVLLPGLRRDDAVRRYSVSDGSWKKLVKCEAGDLIDLTESTDQPPSRYFISATATPDEIQLNLDLPAGEDYSLKVFGWFYTTYPSDYSLDIWLSKTNPSLIVAQVMLNQVGLLRDETVLSTWQPIYDRNLRTVLLADDDLKQSNQSSVMNYGRTDL